MAGLQPPMFEGLPSFASMVRGHASLSHRDHQDTIKLGGQYKGEHALFFSTVEVSNLSGDFQFVLVGKFSHERPPMEFNRCGFQTIGFKGEFHLSLLDSRHILIRFDLEEDFHRCWLHGSWSFKKHVMRLLKWTPPSRSQENPYWFLCGYRLIIFPFISFKKALSLYWFSH